MLRLVLQNKLIWWLWKKYACKYGYHLWDEVLTTERHYLYCDACGKSVTIEGVEDE